MTGRARGARYQPCPATRLRLEKDESLSTGPPAPALQHHALLHVRSGLSSHPPRPGSAPPRPGGAEPDSPLTAIGGTAWPRPAACPHLSPLCSQAPTAPSHSCDPSPVSPEASSPHLHPSTQPALPKPAWLFQLEEVAMLLTSTSPVGSPTPQGHQPPKTITRCHVTWHGEPSIQTPSAAGHHSLQPHGLCGVTNIPGSGYPPAPHGPSSHGRLQDLSTATQRPAPTLSVAGAAQLAQVAWTQLGLPVSMAGGSTASGAAMPAPGHHCSRKQHFFAFRWKLLFGFITKLVPVGSCARGHRRAEPLPLPLLPDSGQLSCGEPSGAWGRRGCSSAFPLQDRIVPGLARPSPARCPLLCFQQALKSPQRARPQDLYSPSCWDRASASPAPGMWVGKRSHAAQTAPARLRARYTFTLR